MSYSTPAGYLDRYLHLLLRAENAIMEVKVDKYLQNDGGTRAHNALAAKDALLAQVMRENGYPSAASIPFNFGVGGWRFVKKDVVEVFMGKGSPQKIAGVLRLAHHFGMIQNNAERKPGTNVAPVTAQEYCDRYLGLDCNGFVGNYFGLDPNKMIGEYDRTGGRRACIDEVQQGDVLVWHRGGADYPHIALVGSTSSLSRTESEHVQEGRLGQRFAFQMVQSSGRGGAHEEMVTKTFEKNREGKLFFEDAERRAKVFIVPPANAGNPTE